MEVGRIGQEEKRKTQGSPPQKAKQQMTVEMDMKSKVNLRFSR